MTRRWMPAAAAAILLLAACDLGPDYRRPPTPTPAAWQEPAGAGAWPAADWWKGFGSAELDRLMEQAQAANPDLAAAAARVAEADAQVQISRAALLPSVGVDFDAGRQRELLLGQHRNVTTFTLAPTATYQTDFWQRSRAQLQAAQASAQGGRYARQVVALTIVGDVANSYFQILALQDRIAVARRNLQNAEDVLKGVDAQQRVGNATLLDVVQQRTTVAQVQAGIPPLEEQLKQTTATLATLVGRLPEDLAAGPAPQATLSAIAAPPVAPGLPSELLIRRPDVQQAETQLVAANANIRSARAAFFPQLNLTAGGGFASAALNTLLLPSSSIFNLTAGLTQPIFQGGALTGQLHLTQAQYQELVADYRKSVLAAFSDVEKALAATSKTAEQLADQENTVRLARRSFEIAQVQYRVGSITLLTVLNTQNALFPAEDALVQVRLAHLAALVSLFQALGGGWTAQPQETAPAERASRP